MKRKKQKVNHIAFFVLMIILTLLAGGVSRPLQAQEDYRLLIISPYDADSESVVRTNTDWVEYAQILSEYKTATGMSAEVMHLGGIFETFTGVDEAEQVKQAIYNEVLLHNVDYVIMVGDFGVFPVRYQSTGYKPDGTGKPSYSEKYCEKNYEPPEDPPCTDKSGYMSIPIDAYFANLWSNEDPDRVFDDWDQNHNGFFGELYCENIRGTDGNTIHPDVAVGRVPARDPGEFLNYLTKILVFENRVPDSPYSQNALLLSDDFGGRWGTEASFGAILGSSFDLTYLVEADDVGTFQTKSPGSPISDIDIPPSQFVSEYIRLNNPRFVNHAGHGNTNIWIPDKEILFASRASIMLLNNQYHPSVAVSAGCRTARFAEVGAHETLPVTPFTGTNKESMAEAFLTESTHAGVIYIGSPINNQPSALTINEHFFEAVVEEGKETVGDAWLWALEKIITDNDLDNMTSGRVNETENSCDSYPIGTATLNRGDAFR
ncbi:MAG: hypothetical protein GY805_37160, partial [Chloroflexi bacterium]|nr:hypothetical protein [Chloroflexota bacterium]